MHIICTTVYVGDFSLTRLVRGTQVPAAIYRGNGAGRVPHPHQEQGSVQQRSQPLREGEAPAAVRVRADRAAHRGRGRRQVREERGKLAPSSSFLLSDLKTSTVQ